MTDEDSSTTDDTLTPTPTPTPTTLSDPPDPNPYTVPRQNYETSLFGITAEQAASDAYNSIPASGYSSIFNTDPSEPTNIVPGSSNDDTSPVNITPYPTMQIDSTEIVNLSDYINLETGGRLLYQHEYDEMMKTKAIEMNPMPSVCEDCDDLTSMRVIIPNIKDQYTSPVNYPFTDLITRYGCQFVPFMYYVTDIGPLIKYENFFNTNKTAFILRKDAIKHIKDAEYPT
jgi:hypothetical protein